MDIRYIQALLGHVKLETTSLYTQVSIRELKRLHSALHPAVRLQHHTTTDEAAEGAGAATARELLEALDSEAVEEET